MFIFSLLFVSNVEASESVTVDNYLSNENVETVITSEFDEVAAVDVYIIDVYVDGEYVGTVVVVVY